MESFKAFLETVGWEFDSHDPDYRAAQDYFYDNSDSITGSAEARPEVVHGQEDIDKFYGFQFKGRNWVAVVNSRIGFVGAYTDEPPTNRQYQQLDLWGNPSPKPRS